MSKPLSIIFCGTPAFAVPALRTLAEDPAFAIALVVTQPDRPVGRAKELTAPAVKEEAKRLNLPVFQPENFNAELLPYLEREGLEPPDFLVVVAYGKIVSEAILQLPRIAPINVHASLLPRWRGASPVEHAILAGDAETGVTVQIMAPGLDEGDVLAVARTPIDARETTPVLKERLSHLGASLLADTLKHPLHPQPQPSEGVTFCRKLSRDDGLADAATMTAAEIDRRVRALNPWPGVTLAVEGREIKVQETSLQPIDGATPLPCADGTIVHLVTVQPPGKKPMQGAAWKRGIAAAFLVCTTLLSPTPSTHAQSTSSSSSSSLSSLSSSSSSPADIDGDGISDGAEDHNQNGAVDAGETDPLKADTDGGGEADGSEVRAGRNPLAKEDDYTYDQDGDGLTNGQEALLGTNPKNADTDGDGVPDGRDAFPLERAYSRDANNNGLADEWEEVQQAKTQKPLVPAADDDGDQLTNAQEFASGTDPLSNDTDRDGTPDGEELEKGSNPEESPCLTYVALNPVFADMQGHWAQTIAVELSRTHIEPSGIPIVRGYDELTEGGADQTLFLPDRPISRFEFLKIALLSSCIKLQGPQESQTNFPDVPAYRPREDEDRALRRRIVATAVAHGIVQGYADGTFKPDAPVSRAEALKMLLLATRLSPLPEEERDITFPDVLSSDWFYPYVRQAFSLQLVEGFEDGTFHPGSAITRAEAAKIVYYALMMNPGVNGYVMPAPDEE